MSNPYFTTHNVTSNAPSPSDNEVTSLQKINSLLVNIAASGSGGGGGGTGNVTVNGSNVLTSPTASQFYSANPVVTAFNTRTGAVTLTTADVNGVGGAALTNLNASNLASGTVPSARLPAISMGGVDVTGTSTNNAVVGANHGSLKFDTPNPYGMYVPSGNAGLYFGNGTPIGIIASNIALYLDVEGGIGALIYRTEDNGNTWMAIL